MANLGVGVECLGHGPRVGTELLDNVGLTMDERMRDAAFSVNISEPWNRAVAGYYGGPEAYNVWSAADWRRWANNRKLPIWVAGLDGTGEGHNAVDALRNLGVPRRVYTAVDMETRVDKTYLEHFGAVLNAAGYKVWVYGSASSLFSNPGLNGYWVADYTGEPFMYNHSGVRATQYTPGEYYDSSTVKDWTYHFGRWWR